MALLKFLKGNYANLGAKAISEGQVLVCGDTGELFVDVSANKRVKIGDFNVIENLVALEALDATSVPTSRLYYVEEGNILVRSNGQSWTQINKQKTLAELGGVAKSVYEAKVAALEKADTDNAAAISKAQGDINTLTSKIGTVEDNKTVVELISAAQTQADKGVADAAAVAADLAEHITEADSKYETKTNVTNKVNAVQADVGALETYVGTIPEGYSETNVISYINKKAQETLDAASGGSSESAASVLAALNTYKTENDSKVTANTKAIDAIEADYLKAADKTELSNAIAAEQTRATDIEGGLRTDVDAIKKDYLKTSDKTELQDNIDAVDALVDTLIGTDTGKSARTIANEELAKQLIPENAAESLNTLTEIAAWIQAHPDDASAMNEAISALQTKVGDIPNEATASTIVAYIQEAVAAEKSRAEGAESGLDARLDTIEAKFGEGEGSVASQIAKAKSEAISTAADDATTKANAAKTDAIAAAKTYTDTEVGKDRARLATLEADTHTHANKTELDKIAAGDKAKWDAMEQNAKTYADSLADNYDAAGSAANAETKAKAYADGLASNYDAVGSAAQALTDAKAYADTAESDAVATSKAYTESMLQWSEF